MMNKIFILLLVLTLAGGALLFWLLRTMPQNMASDPHAEKKESLVVAKPEGVEVHGGASEEKKEGEEGAPAGEKSEAKDSRESPVLKIETEPVKAVVFVDGEMKGQTPLELALSTKEQQVKLEAPGFKDVSREAPAIKPDMDLDTLTWKIVMRAQPGSLKVSPRALEADEDLALNPKKGKKKGKAVAKAEAKVEKPKAEAKPVAEKVVEKSVTAVPPVHEAEIPTPKAETVKAAAAPKAKEKPAEKTAEKATEKPTAKTTEKSTEPPAPEDNDKATASENPSNILFLNGRSGPTWIQIQAIPSTQKSAAETNIREYRKALNLNVMGCEVAVKGKGKWVRVLTGPFDSKTEASRMLGTINARLRDPAFVTGAQECL